MHDSDRRDDLRAVIDLLPWGKRQKALAVESIDGMSEVEKDDMLALYEQVVTQLPAALEAVKQIRGINSAIETERASPFDSEQ
ncbi:hypothetical protein VH569_11110 [Azospirillum sp. 11R-A]|uniref:hypothetical protein n=1 Tax=Azospirillum sp. 11R-A TaxID=3111634 RepID=UPI003C282021